jgi:hypothetical protein
MVQSELLPEGFHRLPPPRRAVALEKTPICLMTGIVASPSGFCFGGIDPEDLNTFYSFSYKPASRGSTKKYRHLVKSVVRPGDGRRLIGPYMRKVKNGAIVWGESGNVHGAMSIARAMVQLLAQNLDQVSDSNPVLRRCLERLSCSQACLVGARDDSGIPVAQVIRNAEILRGIPSVMHIGPACAAGGRALDFLDGRYYNMEKSYFDHKNFDLKTDALRREGCEDPNEFKKLFVEYLDSGEEVFKSLFTQGYMAKYSPAGTASSETSASTSTSPSGAPTTTTPGSQLSMAHFIKSTPHFFKSTPSPRSTPSSTSTSASTSNSEAERNKRKQSKDAYLRLGESLKKNKGKRTEPYDSADDFMM